jgi:hypothetical protein
MSPEFFLTSTRAGFASFDRMKKRVAILICGLEKSWERIENSKGDIV